MDCIANPAPDCNPVLAAARGWPVHLCTQLTLGGAPVLTLTAAGASGPGARKHGRDMRRERRTRPVGRPIFVPVGGPTGLAKAQELGVTRGADAWVQRTGKKRRRNKRAAR